MPSRPLSRRRLLTLGAAGCGLAAGLLSACGGAAQVAVQTASSSAATAAPTTTASSAASSPAATTSVAATASTAAASTATAAVAASSSAPAAPAAGTVEYWQWGAGYVPGFDTLAKAFNADHPNAKVAPANPASQPEYWNKIVTLQAGGTGPDAFLINNTSFKQWARTQGVADISAMAAADKAVSAALGQTFPAIADWYHYKGKLMGLPWDFSAGVVNYNLDHFQAAGLTPINDLGKSWDWNKLKEYATALTQKSSSAMTRSGIWINSGTENGWYSFCVANGGSFFNATLDQCTLASPESIAGLEFVQGLLKDGVAADSAFKSAANKANPNPGQTFTNGATSMDFEGDWNFTSYEKAKNPIRWDAGIFPYSPSTGKTANTSNLRGVVLNPVSKKKDATWAWMAYLTTPAVQAQIPTLFGEIPSNMGAADANYLDPAKGGPPPGRKFLKPDLDATSPLPASDLIVSTELGKAYSQPIADAYALKITAADALKQIQETVSGMLSAAKAK